MGFHWFQFIFVLPRVKKAHPDTPCLSGPLTNSRVQERSPQHFDLSAEDQEARVIRIISKQPAVLLNMYHTGSDIYIYNT